MKKMLPLIPALLIVVAVGVFLFTMPGKDNPSPANQETTNAPASKPNEVIIDDFEFKTADLKVKKGTTVTWTNKDSAHHDVTPSTESEAFKASKLLGQGESYQFTFDTPGSYEYYCSPHPYMKATIEVTE